MTKLLEEAIAQVLELPEDTQNMAADALLMVVDYVNDDAHYHLTDEQISGVHHAMGQADRVSLSPIATCYLLTGSATPRAEAALRRRSQSSPERTTTAFFPLRQISCGPSSLARSMTSSSRARARLMDQSRLRVPIMAIPF